VHGILISEKVRQESKLMWIFTQKGFLSIVRHTDKPNVLIVRSRFRGHIEKMFPNAHVTENIGTDYRYRAELNPEEVSKAIAKMILEIDYPNFKGSLDSDGDYASCCLDVYIAVAKNSDDWDFSQFQCLREGLNER
jgi:hypothetical protein